MRRTIVAGLVSFGLLAGCSSDGGFGMEGSPAWKMRTSQAEQDAFYSRFKPYDEVMMNGEILTSNMASGNMTVTQVKYEGRMYTCKARDLLIEGEQRSCKY